MNTRRQLIDNEDGHMTVGYIGTKWWFKSKTPDFIKLESPNYYSDQEGIITPLKPHVSKKTVNKRSPELSQ